LIADLFYAPLIAIEFGDCLSEVSLDDLPPAYRFLFDQDDWQIVRIHHILLFFENVHDFCIEGDVELKPLENELA